MGPRTLTAQEIDEVMATNSICRLATIDDDGFPHITPLWFHWDGRVLRVTSRRHKPHVRRLQSNYKACALIDVEEPERSDGERSNKQVRFIGEARAIDDVDGMWTRRITSRSLTGPAAEGRAQERASQQRVVIELRPAKIVAVASV